jgi:hypothetical protein
VGGRVCGLLGLIGDPAGLAAMSQKCV